MAAHDKHAPGLPKIVDEAADTPLWVPALGVGLFALLAIFAAIRLASPPDAPAADEAGAAQAAAAADGGGP